MPSRARAIAAAVALLIGLTTVPLAPAAVRAAPEAGGACSDGWQRHELPRSARDARLYEVLTRRGKPAWLLGGSNDGPVALRWKKGRWADAGVRGRGTTAFMAGSVGKDASTWVVGNERPRRGVMKPIGGTVGGGGWQRRGIRGVPGQNVALAGVATKGRDRAWAVGTRLQEGRTQAYALQWTGRRWERRDPPAGDGESGLTAAASVGSSDVWAVGWRTGGRGMPRPYIVRAKGSGWTASDSAPLPPGIAALSDVHFRAGHDGWAVGYLVPEGSSRHEPILEHWDGSDWTRVAIETDSEDSLVPRSVTVDQDGGVWLAGTALRTDGGGSRGFVARRSDGAWHLDDGLVPDDVTSELFSIAPVDGGVIVTGIVGREAAVFGSCTTAEPGGSTGTSSSSAPSSDAATSPSTGATGGGSASEVDTGATAGAGAGATAGAGAGATAVAGAERRSFLAATPLGSTTRPKAFSIRDMARKAGLRKTADTLAGLTADLDGDGWTDVLYWNHGDEPHFYLGGPERFVKGPADAFGRIDRHVCSVADADLDGRLDLFCSSGRQRGSSIDEHELSLGPAFAEGGPAPDVLGVSDPFGRGRAATFIHLDDDELPDLFVSNSPDRGDGLPGTNRFFRNMGGRFVAAPEVGLDRSTGGWCAVAADIDGDEDEDLLHCTESSDDGRPAGLRVYLNDEGALRERSRALGLRPIEDIALIAADMTGDGRMDLIQLSHKELRVSQGTRSGFRRIYGAKVPFAEGVATGDVNGDGALDIYVATGGGGRNEPDVLLVNKGKGGAYRNVRIPQAKRGSGAGVMALDYDHNGLTDFVVLNGRGDVRGPIQLLASFPVRKKRR